MWFVRTSLGLSLPGVWLRASPEALGSWALDGLSHLAVPNPATVAPPRIRDEITIDFDSMLGKTPLVRAATPGAIDELASSSMVARVSAGEAGDAKASADDTTARATTGAIPLVVRRSRRASRARARRLLTVPTGQPSQDAASSAETPFSRHRIKTSRCLELASSASTSASRQPLSRSAGASDGRRAGARSLVATRFATP